MNIFVLHEDPYESAKAHCDKHVNKMLLEAVQIANTGLHLAGVEKYAFYKPTHKNHPWCSFAAKSFDHFYFVLRRAQTLASEFLRRYDARHKSHEKMEQNWPHATLNAIEGELGHSDDVWEDIPQAMPDTYTQNDAVKAYRAYYRNEKFSEHWFSYEKADPPSWFVQGTPFERWQT